MRLQNANAATVAASCLIHVPKWRLYGIEVLFAATTVPSADSQVSVMDTKNLNELNQRRRANGEFGNKLHAEAEGTLPDRTEFDLELVQSLEGEQYDAEVSQILLGDIRSNLELNVSSGQGWRNSLVYISYDDSFSEDQIGRYLSGDHDGVTEDLENRWLDDHRWEMARESATTLCREDYDIDFSELPDETQNEITGLLCEHDTSDPLNDLATNTHSQLMRAGVVPDFYKYITEHTPGRSFLNEEEVQGRIKAINAALSDAGYTITEADKSEIESLINEGPEYWHEGVRLDVIWNGDIETAALEPNYDKTGSKPEPKKLVSENGVNIVLLDTMNGSGYEAKLSGPFAVSLNEENPARLDSPTKGWGYGWDDTAGVVHTYYDTDFQVS